MNHTDLMLYKVMLSGGTVEHMRFRNMNPVFTTTGSRFHQLNATYVDIEK